MSELMHLQKGCMFVWHCQRHVKWKCHIFVRKSIHHEIDHVIITVNVFELRVVDMVGMPENVLLFNVIHWPSFHLLIVPTINLLLLNSILTLNYKDIFVRIQLPKCQFGLWAKQFASDVNAIEGVLIFLLVFLKYWMIFRISRLLTDEFNHVLFS